MLGRNRIYNMDCVEGIYDHIISWSNPGDVVLDPFMGSGTVAKMARLAGRDYIGFEISPEYCAIAEERLKYASSENH